MLRLRVNAFGNAGIAPRVLRTAYSGVGPRDQVPHRSVLAARARSPPPREGTWRTRRARARGRGPSRRPRRRARRSRPRAGRAPAGRPRGGRRRRRRAADAATHAAPPQARRAAPNRARRREPNALPVSVNARFPGATMTGSQTVSRRASARWSSVSPSKRMVALSNPMRVLRPPHRHDSGERAHRRVFVAYSVSIRRVWRVHCTQPYETQRRQTQGREATPALPQSRFRPKRSGRC